MGIHDLKGYRNACRVVQNLGPYVHQSYYDKEKIIYLNKDGREVIASTKEESKRGNVEHTLFRNDVYIHFDCPINWQAEYTLEASVMPQRMDGIMVLGLSVAEKKKVVADAVFKRNGYFNIIEIDNERKMVDNKRKIQIYREILPAFKEEVPCLYFFTKTEHRKRKLLEWMKGMRGDVKTYAEIT